MSKKDYGITNKISNIANKVSKLSKQEEKNPILGELEKISDKIESESLQNNELAIKLKHLITDFQIDMSYDNNTQSNNQFTIFNNFISENRKIQNQLQNITKNILEISSDSKNMETLLLLEHSGILRSIEALETTLITYINDINNLKKISTVFLTKLQFLINWMEMKDDDNIIKEMYRITNNILKYYNNISLSKK